MGGTLGYITLGVCNHIGLCVPAVAAATSRRVTCLPCCSPALPPPPRPAPRAVGESRYRYFRKGVLVPDTSFTDLEFDFSAFDTGNLWAALFSFLYLDFLDATGTFFAMANVSSGGGRGLGFRIWGLGFGVIRHGQREQRRAAAVQRRPARLG